MEVVAARCAREQWWKRGLSRVHRRVVVAARAVAPWRLRARLAGRTSLTIGPLPGQASIRRRCCVVRARNTANAESHAWNRDTRPLAPVWEGALRHERSVDWVDFRIPVDEGVLFAHERERVGLEARLRQLLSRWADPIRVLPRATRSQTGTPQRRVGGVSSRVGCHSRRHRDC